MAEPGWPGGRLSSWTWLVMAWALLSTALWLSLQAQDALALEPLVALLDWQPALWQTQPWRLWTAAVVHWSGTHLLLNLLGCAALIAWGNAAGAETRQTCAWLLAWPLTQLLLATTPSLVRFGGLSGVLHAGVAIGAWALVWQGQGQRRVVGVLVLVGLALKVFVEEPLLVQWLGLNVRVLDLNVRVLPLAGAPGFAVASYAHLTGTVAGLFCALALDLALGLVRRR